MSLKLATNFQPLLAVDLSKQRGFGIAVTNKDVARLWISTDWNELNAVDVNGIPLGGVILAPGSLPLIYQRFSDRLWARTDVAAVQFDVDVFAALPEEDRVAGLLRVAKRTGPGILGSLTNLFYGRKGR